MINVSDGVLCSGSFLKPSTANDQSVSISHSFDFEEQVV